MTRSLTVCDLSDYRAGGARREHFINSLGEALQDIGFFALTGHGISTEAIKKSYEVAEEFFSLPQETKAKYEQSTISRQRGYTPYGVEHAKDNPAPDLKEFWQTGRTIDDENFPKNIWPNETPEFEQSIDGLYNAMESMSLELLSAASIYLGKDADWLPSMAENGNTILRVIHYPALGDDAPEGAVRSAKHEDINLITLLVGATAEAYK